MDSRLNGKPWAWVARCVLVEKTTISSEQYSRNWEWPSHYLSAFSALVHCSNPWSVCGQSESRRRIFFAVIRSGSSWSLITHDWFLIKILSNVRFLNGCGLLMSSLKLLIFVLSYSGMKTPFWGQYNDCKTTFTWHLQWRKISFLCLVEYFMWWQYTITRLFRMTSFRTKSRSQRSFSYMDPATWNHLPVSVCHATTVTSFSSSLNTFLFS